MRALPLLLFGSALVWPAHTRSTYRPPADVTLLIAHVTVIDVRTGQHLRDRAVVVDGDSIVAVTDSNGAEQYAAERVVDARGAFLIPGLWDMHVRIGGGDALTAQNRDLLPVYVAFGVTAVREVGGDVAPTVLAWRDSILRTEMLGPRVLSAGPALGGPAAGWAKDLEAVSKEDVDGTIDRLHSMGVDLVSLEDGALTPDLIRYALEASAQRGLSTSARLPAGVTVRDAAQRGLRTIEHLTSVLPAGIEGDGLTLSREVLARFDAKRAASEYRLVAERGTAITPLLHLERTLAWLGSDDHSGDEALKYVGREIEARYERARERALRLDPTSVERARAVFEFSLSAMPLLRNAGVTILAGSGAGYRGPYVYPGASLHDELSALVQSGLSPLQALQAATVNPARVMGRDGRLGTIEPGRVADLVLLDADPTRNIGATRRIRGVALRGEYYDRGALDDLLDDAAADRLARPR